MSHLCWVFPLKSMLCIACCFWMSWFDVCFIIKLRLCGASFIFVFVSVSWVENQRQNEQRCGKEIEDIRRGRAGNVAANNTSLTQFSEEALDEQKHSVRIADEKVALAMQAYDLVCFFLINLSFQETSHCYMVSLTSDSCSFQVCYIKSLFSRWCNCFRWICMFSNLTSIWKNRTRRCAKVTVYSSCLNSIEAWASLSYLILMKTLWFSIRERNCSCIERREQRGGREGRWR